MHGLVALLHLAMSFFGIVSSRLCQEEVSVCCLAWRMLCSRSACKSLGSLILNF